MTLPTITILGLDTASRTGWAVRRSGVLVASGEVATDQPDLPLAVVARAVHVAAVSCTPLIVAMEVHPWLGRMSAATGLAVARERWRVALKACHVPMMRVVKVTPSEWRTVLGKGRPRKRDALRECELRMASASVPAHVVLGADEAAAILISLWATHSERVISRVKVRQQRGHNAGHKRRVRAAVR